MNSLSRFSAAVWLIAFCGGEMQAAEPPRQVSIAVPNYETAKLGALDRVRIPGGEVLTIEEGRPLVPFYVKKFDYPAGYRIQKVIMTARTRRKTASGLRLPVVVNDTYRRAPVPMKEGLYPTKDYDWHLRDNEDGTSSLYIRTYPFFYDPKTTGIVFYQDYTFEIAYIQSSVQIAELHPERLVYSPGEKVILRVQLKNSGRTQDATVTPSIRKGTARRTPVQLASKRVAKLGKTAQVLFEWPTPAGDPGNYTAEAVVRDSAGNELARRQTRFRVGNPKGELTGFTALPQRFKIGESVRFRVDFKNTGACNLTGECVIRISRGSRIETELRAAMEGLRPGASMAFQKSWDTGKAQKDAVYYATALVRFESSATAPKSLMLSTNAQPTAAFIVATADLGVGQQVQFDASTSKDVDGKIVRYAWDFDDGGEAEGAVVRHVYQQSGDYRVRLTVTDSQGGESTKEQLLSIKR